MSDFFCQSFDNGVHTSEWSYTGISQTTSAGNTGLAWRLYSSSLTTSQYVASRDIPDLGGSTSWAFHIKLKMTPEWPEDDAKRLVRLYRNTTLICAFGCKSDGDWYFENNGGSTPDFTNAYTLDSAWHSIEVVYNHSAGTLQLYDDQRLVAEFTSGHSTLSPNQLQAVVYGQHNGLGESLWLDDIVFGPMPTGIDGNLWGPSRVVAVDPDADGYFDTWDRSDLFYDKWEHVTGIDSRYLEAPVWSYGNSQSVGFGAVTSDAVTIHGVSRRLRAKYSGSTTQARLFANRGASKGNGSTITLSNTYQYFREGLAFDPIASSAWTRANLNSTEFGCTNLTSSGTAKTQWDTDDLEVAYRDGEWSLAGSVSVSVAVFAGSAEALAAGAAPVLHAAVIDMAFSYDASATTVTPHAEEAWTIGESAGASVTVSTEGVGAVDAFAITATVTGHDFSYDAASITATVNAEGTDEDTAVSLTVSLPVPGINTQDAVAVTVTLADQSTQTEADAQAVTVTTVRPSGSYAEAQNSVTVTPLTERGQMPAAAGMTVLVGEVGTQEPLPITVTPQTEAVGVQPGSLTVTTRQPAVGGEDAFLIRFLVWLPNEKDAADVRVVVQPPEESGIGGQLTVTAWPTEMIDDVNLLTLTAYRPSWAEGPALVSVSVPVQHPVGPLAVPVTVTAHAPDFGVDVSGIAGIQYAIAKLENVDYDIAVISGATYTGAVIGSVAISAAEMTGVGYVIPTIEHVNTRVSGAG